MTSSRQDIASWGLALMALAGLQDVEAAESIPVVPGLEYARHEEEGLISHVVKMDLKAKGLRIRSVKAKGKETIRELVQRMDEPDSPVLAGINGDFFRQSSSAGLPYGIQVADGRLIFAPMKRSMIGFGPKNEPYIGIVSLSAKFTFARKEDRKQAKWALIDDINVVEGESDRKSGIYLYTPAFLGLDLTRPSGLVAVVEAIEPALQVGDICEGKVSQVVTSGKAVSVPETGCLLYFFGDAGRAVGSALKPGQPLALKIELPPIVGGVAQALGGGPRLVRDGKVGVELNREVFDPVHAMEISKRHPRSAIGYDRNRQFLFLVMVEGRHEGSRGMTFGELGEFMAKLGCHQAMAFDGGGSAGMHVAGRGTVTLSMGGSNRPEERQVANGLLITASKAAPAEKVSSKTTPKEARKEAGKPEAKGSPSTGTKVAPERRKPEDPYGETPLKE